MSHYESESRSWGIAARAISERVRAMPEFQGARATIVTEAIRTCRGKSVSEMRALGGFSEVLARLITRLPAELRTNVGSRLLPTTVAGELVVRDRLHACRGATRACQRSGARVVTHRTEYGTFEVAVEPFESPWRTDRYTPHREGSKSVLERRMADGPKDESAPHAMYPNGYDSRCSCCYLNIPHTENLHTRKTVAP